LQELPLRGADRSLWSCQLLLLLLLLLLPLLLLELLTYWRCRRLQEFQGRDSATLWLR